MDRSSRPSYISTCLYWIRYAHLHLAPVIPSLALSNGSETDAAVLLAKSQVHLMGHCAFVCGRLFLGVSCVIQRHRGFGRRHCHRYGDNSFCCLRTKKNRRSKGCLLYTSPSPRD